MSAVCICCSTNSRFCTPLSSFASVGKNSRSIAVVVISVDYSAAHSNIISDSSITPAKNASVFFDHCWKCSSRPVKHQQVQILRPLELGSEKFLLKLRHNLLHRHRHRYSSEFLKLVQQAIAATRQVNTFQRIPGHSSCHRTQARQATAVQQTRSTREHDTTAGSPPPAVHHTNNESSNPCAPRAHCVTSDNSTSWRSKLKSQRSRHKSDLLMKSTPLSAWARTTGQLLLVTVVKPLDRL